MQDYSSNRENKHSNNSNKDNSNKIADKIVIKIHTKMLTKMSILNQIDHLMLVVMVNNHSNNS